ncbi:MAG: hypothetical protein O2822_06440 [Chloroflexi bacterium]|nr:hypothetical protein [Chloroflexota bacterium]
MRLITFLLTTSAAAGAYAAARRLIADPALIERLPGPVQGPATCLRARLVAVRDLVAEGMREGRTERDAAEQELMQEYRRRAQR